MPKHPNENTAITFMPSRPKAILDAKTELKLRTIVRDQLLLKRPQPYLSAKIRIKPVKDPAAERTVIVYLLRADTYTAEVLKLTIDARDQVTAQQEDYVDDEDDQVKPRGALSRTFEFVCGTPVPEIPTAKAAVEAIAALAQGQGLRTKILLGPEASVANYKAYLCSGLKGFVNVGHGNTSLIVLDDGALTATWFHSLVKRPVKPAVVYFNSCQVFNPPLEPQIMAAGAHTFIGGKVNLLIGPSEAVCTRFWGLAMVESMPMHKALEKAEQEKYPTHGAHGLAGDEGHFVTHVPALGRRSGAGARPGRP